MVRRVFLFVGILSLVCVLGIAAIWGLDRAGFFSVVAVDIGLVATGQSIQHLSDEVEKIQKRFNSIHGRSLLDLDLMQEASFLSKYQWIESHNVRKMWPNRVFVEIRPYEVKALYFSRPDGFTPVVADGRLLDSVDAASAPDAPLLEGKLFLRDPELRRKALQMLEELPFDGPVGRRSLGQITWDQKMGFLVRLVGAGVEVHLGHDDFAVKAQRVAKVLEYLNSRKMNARVIDANLSKKVLVRLRKAP
ncbi:MAG: FtsQ-type POTRA domain-containing protein [Bdellovibrionaceae bacterium]|nr:FtsQ-type POTRA domain-containing protein [Pseudobdellovibrionaceae bacterium]